MEIRSLTGVAEVGARCVLYLLFAVSAAQLALMIERGVLFLRSRVSRETLERLLREGLAAVDPRGAVAELERTGALAGRVLAHGLSHVADGPEAVDEVLRSRTTAERQQLERGLAFLGTVGNNAPFLGLFGTVLGIIKAFADLADQGGAKASRAVIAGISEALVATAVGLLVALPAVVAFNVFQRSIKSRVSDAESLGGMLLAKLKATSSHRSRGEAGAGTSAGSPTAP
jgi:biopolymer transport protein ExbB